MKATIAILFALVAVSSAFPIKPDDYAKFEQEAEKIANADVGAWGTAAEMGDRMTRVSLIEKAIKILEEAQENNKKLDSKMLPLMEKMQGMANKGHTWLLDGLAKLIDGNRDNKSYFLLQGVEKWAEKRASTGEPEVASAGKHAKAAKEHLDKMAGTFVKGVKDIKANSGNKAKLQEITANTVKTAKENSPKMISETDAALRDLKTLRDNVQSGNDVKVNKRAGPMGELLGSAIAGGMLG